MNWMLKQNRGKLSKKLMLPLNQLKPVTHESQMRISSIKFYKLLSHLFIEYMVDLKYISSHPEVFLGKAVLKICCKFTGEHPCRSVILIKLLCNFIEITLRHGWSPVNLQHIFRTAFPKNTSGRLHLK